MCIVFALYNLFIILEILKVWLFHYSFRIAHLIVKTCHHSDELFELNLTVAILVNLFDNSINCLSTEWISAAEAEDISDFFCWNYTRTIFVKHAEGSM